MMYFLIYLTSILFSSSTFAWNCPQSVEGYPYSKEFTHLGEYGDAKTLEGWVEVQDLNENVQRIKNSADIDLKKLESQDIKIVGYGGEDSTLLFQRAIKCAFDYSIKKIIVDPKVYILKSRSSQNSLVFYGKKITFEGNGAFFVKDSPSGGYFGDAFDVYGLIPNSRYPDVTVDQSEAGHFVFQGHGSPAEEIILKDFSIYHVKQVKYMNSVGVVNAKSSKIINVNSFFSPQTAFATVTVNVGPEKFVASVDDLLLSGTRSIQSGYHAYRVSQQSRESTLKVKMVNIRSVGVRNTEVYETEVNGNKLHLWYRPIVSDSKVSLEVENSSFDRSARVMTSIKTNGLFLNNNTISGGLILKGPGPYSLDSNQMDCDAKLDISKSSKGTILNNQFTINRDGTFLNECLITDDLFTNTLIGNTLLVTPSLF